MIAAGEHADQHEQNRNPRADLASVEHGLFFHGVYLLVYCISLYQICQPGPRPVFYFCSFASASVIFCAARSRSSVAFANEKRMQQAVSSP